MSVDPKNYEKHCQTPLLTHRCTSQGGKNRLLLDKHRNIYFKYDIKEKLDAGIFQILELLRLPNLSSTSLMGDQIS